MITIGYSTRTSNPTYKEYLQKTCMYKEVQIIEKINNGDKSLSQVYNEILDESKYDIVVLCHDDLEFETKNWGEKLIKSFEKNPDYGILGLAGTKYLDSSGQWWKVPQTMYGIVNHKHEGKKWTSTYSPHLGNEVEETVLIDGLFISLNKNKIKHKFDESIEGFHFYDLGFCVPNFLDGVKIGVIFNNRVTHLSIGQTNQQWETNRIKFAEKYKNKLPMDITNFKDESETFIFVHDQKIILDFEEKGKFKNFNNYKYVFLGNRPIDKIESLNNVIIANKFEKNLENYPLFTAFTGWYLLWKNGLISKKFINLFEYDIIISENLPQVLNKLVDEKWEMVGYIPFPANHSQYIRERKLVDKLFEAIKSIYKIDFEKTLNTSIKSNPNMLWSSTSNITMESKIFDEFMKWFDPMIDFMKEDTYCGHSFERAISFFYLLKGKKVALTRGLIQHLQMNSHETQPHKMDFEVGMKKLVGNL